MSSVAFREITKEFDGTKAVDDLTLEIADQEFLVLLGPSGCGKSTALRMLAGLETPTSGIITIDGRAVNDVAPKDRDVAMVFQSYALYPHMTVAKNIEFPLKARGVERGERAKLVTEAARALRLEPLINRRPAQLSGGQRQRVALARAIVRQPQVFLMDEPLSNLDAKLRVQTRAELIELHRRLDATFVYVTHDQVEAMTMASRIAIMSDGVLQQVGAPQDVYAQPANLFVAQFIGSPPMNTIAGSIGRALGGSDTVTVGTRPEHVEIAAANVGQVDGVLAVVESLGHELHLIIRLADGQTVTARVAAGTPVPAPESPLSFSVAAERVHRFDAATGMHL
jgi:multiple sugar transport system ATP-binding protein